MPDVQDKFLTVEEASERLAVSIWTLRRWLNAGQIHGVKIGRNWRIPERALTELATGGKPTPNNPA